MRKLVIVLLVFGLIVSTLAGCNNDKQNPDPKDPPVTEKPTDPIKEDPIVDDPIGDNPEPQEPDEKEPENPVVDENGLPKKVTFKDAFPAEVRENPENFLTQIIPGFAIGISKSEIEKMLGEPVNSKNIEFEWGTYEQLLYENIKGYRLEVTFNPEGNLADFKLIKDLLGKGIIPKEVHASSPGNGDPISYTELGLRGVLLGAKEEEVLRRYGEPYQTYLSFDEMYGYNLAMVYQGVTAHIRINNSDPHVQLIETNTQGIVATNRGIKVGSTAEEVIEKYGEPEYNWQEAGDIIYATEDYWFAIKFIFNEDGIVEKISIYEAS